MAFTRSKKKQVNRKSEYKPDEADSTVACWPSSAPAKRRRNIAPWERNNGVDWQDGLPEGLLLLLFEHLLAENTKEAREAMHNAAGTCVQWREAFYEVILGDTAASRPVRPPIARDETQDKKPPAATATTCAAVCEPSKSETNGCEACSGRRPPAAVPGRSDGMRGNQHANASPAAAGAAQAAATAVLAAEPVDAAAGEPAVQQFDQQQQQQQGQQQHQQDEDQQQQQQQQQGEEQQHQQRPSRATRAGKLLPPLPELRRRGRGHAAAAAAGNEHMEAGAAGPRAQAAPAAGRRSAAVLCRGGTLCMLSPAPAAAAAVAQMEEAAQDWAGERTRGAARMGAMQLVEHEQQQHSHDEADEGAAGVRSRRRKRRRQQPAAATAGTAGTADTEGDGQQEVMQPTTAQTDAAAAAAAATAHGGRRRAGQRVRASGNAAAAAAAAAAAESDHITEQHQQQHGDDEPSEQQPARQKRARRRRRQRQHDQEQQSQQERQVQAPADSTEAQQLGVPVGQGPAGSQGGQGSGSTRQDGWLGMLNPLHWFRGGSS